MVSSLLRVSRPDLAQSASNRNRSLLSVSSGMASCPCCANPRCTRTRFSAADRVAVASARQRGPASWISAICSLEGLTPARYAGSVGT